MILSRRFKSSLRNKNLAMTESELQKEIDFLITQAETTAERFFRTWINQFKYTLESEDCVLISEVYNQFDKTLKNLNKKWSIRDYKSFLLEVNKGKHKSPVGYYAILLGKRIAMQRFIQHIRSVLKEARCN